MASEGAAASQEEDSDDDAPRVEKNGKLADGGDKEEEEDEEEEEEEEEPRLQYASMTKKLAPIYRNGDATSAFLVAGDKMVRPCWKGQRDVAR